MKTADRSILREISMSKGYEVALLTSYNFEVRFFEKYILSVLLGMNVRCVSLFVDSGELNSALLDSSSELIGKKYFVSPVSIMGSFHPKIVLLLGKDKAKIIVSSANIKLSGYLHNNEVFNSFEYSKDHTEYSAIIAEAIDYYKDLMKICFNRDSNVEKWLNNFKCEREESNVSFISNINEPLLPQVLRRIEGKILSVRIAVPFYDCDLAALKEIKQKTKCNNVNLYIQNKFNTFPIEYNAKHNVVSSNQLNLFNTIQNEKESKSFYHGKVVEFITESNSYVLYGSPNCSSSALLKTHREDGNIECAFLGIAAPNSNDAFFNSFVLSDNETLINGFQLQSATKRENFSFLFGEVNRDEVKLFVSFSSRMKAAFFLNDHPLSYLYTDQFIVISFNSGLLETENRIFTIVVKYADNTEELKCWCNNIQELYQSRNSVSSDLPNISSKNDFGEYTGIVTKIIQQWREHEHWYQDIQKEMLDYRAEPFNVDDVRDEDIEETESNDFIIDLEDTVYSSNTVPYYLYRNFSAVERRVFGVNTKWKGKNEDSAKKQVLEYPTAKATERVATEIEKKLARFFIREFGDRIENLQKVSFSLDMYLLECSMILDTIIMVTEIEKVKDFFPPNYVLSIETYIAELFANNAWQATTPDERNTIITYILLVVFRRVKELHTDKDQAATKNLLNKLNRTIQIRENYLDYVFAADSSIRMIKSGIGKIDEQILNYVDGLFDYKSFERLVEFYSNALGGTATLEIGTTTTVKATVHRNRLTINKALPVNFVDEINSYLKGNKVDCDTLLFVLKDRDSDDYIEFSMKTDLVRVSRVKMKSCFGHNRFIYQCGINNQSYIPNLQKKSLM